MDRRKRSHQPSARKRHKGRAKKPPQPRSSSRARPGPHQPGIEIESLPQEYGKTELVLLPVGPHLAYAYWEIKPNDLESARNESGLPEENVSAVLRFTAQDSIGQQQSFDAPIDLAANNQYVHFPDAGSSYRAELGLRREDGFFTSITRSNVICAPAGSASSNLDLRYGSVGQTAPDPWREQQRSSEPLTADQRGAIQPEPSRREALAPRAIQAQPAGIPPQRSGTPEVQNRPEPPEDPRRATALTPSRPLPEIVDMRQHLRRILTEIYSRRQWTLAAGRSVARRSEGGSNPYNPFFPVDLTEMSEQHFQMGRSSRKT